jgi:hypothetical protein
VSHSGQHQSQHRGQHQSQRQQAGEAHPLEDALVNRICICPLNSEATAFGRPDSLGKSRAWIQTLNSP